MPAETVDDVVRLVSGVVGAARAAGQRTGYFAAIYLAMTRAVQARIAAGGFDDGDRMSGFAATFANRYLDALATFHAGGTPTRAWQAAFACNQRHDRLILQQVLIGVNAHINLDLGIAAALTAPAVPAGGLAALKADFDRINGIIGSLLDAIQDTIGRFSPMMDLLRRVDECTDDRVLNFSFSVARDEAWQRATILAALPPDNWPAAIDSFDRATSVLACLVAEPGGILGHTASLVHHTEHDDPPAVIDALAVVAPKPATG